MQRVMPPRTALTEPWFAACERGELLLQRCTECQHWQFYPRIICAQCDAANPPWVPASGRGQIASFTVLHHALSDAYKTPYAVALVSLAEGPIMMSNIVDTDLGGLKIGAAVTVSFERWDDNFSLPVFTSVREEPTS